MTKQNVEHEVENSSETSVLHNIGLVVEADLSEDASSIAAACSGRCAWQIALSTKRSVSDIACSWKPMFR